MRILLTCLFLLLLSPNILRSQDHNFDIYIKNIVSYVDIVQSILNDETISSGKVNNDFVVILEEWYENRTTKGQWYGKPLNYWFVMGKDGYYKPMDNTMIRLFTVGNRYNWIDDYEKKVDVNVLYNIYVKIDKNTNRIAFMVRNDKWYYQFGGNITHSKSDKIKINITNDKAFMND